MTHSKFFVKASLFFVLITSICFSAYAENPIRDIGIVAGGASKVIGGVFALPTEILKGGFQSFPFGLVTGTVKGTVKTLGGVLGGTLQMAKGAAPYAKYAVFV